VKYQPCDKDSPNPLVRNRERQLRHVSKGSPTAQSSFVAGDFISWPINLLPDGRRPDPIPRHGTLSYAACDDVGPM
jgi:hypothetical protein